MARQSDVRLLERAIDSAGSRAALARCMGLSSSTLRRWQLSGIPSSEKREQVRQASRTCRAEAREVSRQVAKDARLIAKALKTSTRWQLAEHLGVSTRALRSLESKGMSAAQRKQVAAFPAVQARLEREAQRRLETDRRLIDRALKAAKTKKQLAAFFDVTPATITRWQRSGIPEDSRDMMKRAPKALRDTYREIEQVEKEARKVLVDMAEKARLQHNSELENKARAAGVPVDKSELIRKERTTGRRRLEGPKGSGYTWTLSIEKPLSASVLERIEEWIGSLSSPRRLPIWMATVHMSVLYFTNSPLPPSLEKQGSAGPLVQVKGFDLLLQQRFEASLWESTGKKKAKRNAIASVKSFLTSRQAVGSVYVRSVMVYNYREKTERERLDYQAGKRARATARRKGKKS